MCPPRGSKPGIVALRRALADGVVPDGRGHPGALADALTRIGRITNRAGMVVVISDFRDQQHWIRPLGILRARHAVLAVEIGDPREAELPAAGRLKVVDPETGRLIEVDTSRRVRDRFAQLEHERREEIARELRRLRVDHVTLSTEGDWLAALSRRLA